MDRYWKKFGRWMPLLAFALITAMVVAQMVLPSEDSEDRDRTFYGADASSGFQAPGNGTGGNGTGGQIEKDTTSGGKVFSDTDKAVILIIFIATYIMIFSEKVHRTTAAMCGAIAVLLYGEYQEVFSEAEIFGLVKIDIIGLLMGMMMLVGILSRTGFFEFVAVKMAVYSRGRPWKLYLLLGVSAAFLSMIVDNITTVLLMVPLIIEITNKLHISPKPLFIGVAILSNIGGLGTMIGDPPNILIASYADLTFIDFIVHLLPAALVLLAAALLYSKFVYRGWSRTEPERVEEVLEMDAWSVLRDPKGMKVNVAILLGTIFFFFIHEPLGITPAAVALAGGGVALFVSRIDPYRALGAVEWPTLMFFASLFVLIGAVEDIGMMDSVASGIETVSGSDMIIAAMMILWISAFLSSFLDNVPLAAALIPVILRMGAGGMEIGLLWWALAMGVMLGGNASPVGSTAGVIVTGLSDKFGHRITMREWVVVNLPLAIITLSIASLVLVVQGWYFY